MARQAGLTLVELLVTLAVVAVMLGVVFPGFQGLVQRNGLTTSANELIAALQYARSEAARRNETIFFCPADDSDSDDEWGPGWQVVLRDSSESCDSAIGAVDVLRTFDALQGTTTLDATSDVTEFRFNSRGRLVGGASETLEMCIPGKRGVRVSITATGRPSTTKLDGTACS